MKLSTVNGRWKHGLPLALLLLVLPAAASGEGRMSIGMGVLGIGQEAADKYAIHDLALVKYMGFGLGYSHYLVEFGVGFPHLERKNTLIKGGPATPTAMSFIEAGTHLPFDDRKRWGFLRLERSEFFLGYGFFADDPCCATLAGGVYFHCQMVIRTGSDDLQLGLSLRQFLSGDPGAELTLNVLCDFTDIFNFSATEDAKPVIAIRNK